MGAVTFLKDIVRNLKFSDESRVRRVTETDLYNTIIIANSSGVFTCKTKSQTALNSEFVWQISKTVDLGNGNSRRTFANNANFNASIDDLDTLFPFSNNLSMVFDGVDEHMIVPSVGMDFIETDAFTVSIWYKTTQSGSLALWWNKSVDEGLDKSIRLQRLANGDLEFNIRKDGSGRITIQIASQSAFDDDEWHNLVFTYDGSVAAAGVTAYLDSVSQTLVVDSDTLVDGIETGDPWFIAIRPSTLDQPFDGQFDELSFWDVELSTADVVELYNLGTPTDLLLHNATLNMVTWIGFNTFSDGAFPADLKGPNNGTLVNTEDENYSTDVPE